MTSTGAAIAGVALLVALALWAPWFAWPAVRWAWRWARTWPLGPGPLRLRERPLCFARLRTYSEGVVQCLRLEPHGVHASKEGVWWPN